MDFDDFGGMPADEFYLMESLREDEEEMRRQEGINRRVAYNATGGGCCMIAIGIPLILIFMGVLIFFA